MPKRLLIEKLNGGCRLSMHEFELLLTDPSEEERELADRLAREQAIDRGRRPFVV